MLTHTVFPVENDLMDENFFSCQYMFIIKSQGQVSKLLAKSSQQKLCSSQRVNGES